ncbi:MAG: hypothetical protein ABW166_18110 [Sedimenticola sp.]
MKSKSISVSCFIAALLLLPLSSTAAEDEIEQLAEQKTKIEAETTIARKSSEESKVRLERLKQQIAALHKKNQDLDTEIESVTARVQPVRNK